MTGISGRFSSAAKQCPILITLILPYGANPFLKALTKHSRTFFPLGFR